MSLMETQPLAGRNEHILTNPSSPYHKEGQLIDSHPLADLFPRMSYGDIRKLAADIREHGLREPIILLDRKILDGRNRYAACQEAGCEPRFVDFEGDDPAGYVISKNLQRRNLTASQKAVVAYKLLPLLEEEAKKRQLSGKGSGASGGRGNRKPENLGERIPEGRVAEKRDDDLPDTAEAAGRARDHAAAIIGVNPRYVSDLKLVAEQAPGQLETIRNGKVTISHVMRQLRSSQSVADSPGKPMAAKIPKAIREMIQPLNGQRFDIVYADTCGLNVQEQKQEMAGILLEQVLTEQALFFRLGRLDESVDIKWGNTGLLATVVVETPEAEFMEGFNLMVKHCLLAIYATEDSDLRPPERVNSLAQVNDPVNLITAWFPSQQKLLLTGMEEREGWTLFPKLVVGERL